MWIPPAPALQDSLDMEKISDTRDIVAEAFYTCNGLTLFNPQDFYFKYPFAAHSSTDCLSSWEIVFHRMFYAGILIIGSVKTCLWVLRAIILVKLCQRYDIPS